MESVGRFVCVSVCVCVTDVYVDWIYMSACALYGIQKQI